MAISREELKKLVIKEMLEQDLKNEGVGDWLRSKASSMLTTTGKKMTQAGEKVAPPPQLDDKTLRKVGDFLQMAQRDPGITKAILATEFGKQVFGSDEEDNLKEALGADFIKMIKNKKVTPQMLTDFIDSMKKNEKANKMMTGLGLIPKGSKPVEKSDVQQTQTGDTEVSDSDIENEEPASTQQQSAGVAPAAEQPKPTGASTPPGLEDIKAELESNKDKISTAKNKEEIINIVKNVKGNEQWKNQFLEKIETAFNQPKQENSFWTGITSGGGLRQKVFQLSQQAAGQAAKPEEQAKEKQPVPDVVSGTEVTTKNAKIKFLPPVDEEPQAAQQIAKTNADKLGVLKKKFDSGDVLNAKEKDELLRLLGANPQTKGRKGRNPASKKDQKTRQESLQQIIAEEIFNLLTGKIK